MRGSTPAPSARCCGCRRPAARRRRRASARSKSCRCSATGCCRAPTISSASLSYANRRRAEIARALASRPKLLLLDEPTAGMNPAETLELADQIKSLNRLGLTIVLIEHKLDVVVNLADKVIVLDHGEKIAEGIARRGAPRRGGDPRLSRQERDACAARISRRRHALRRSARTEIGRLPDRGGRDRLPAWAATPRANRRR